MERSANPFETGSIHLMMAVTEALTHLHQFEAQRRAETFNGQLLGLGLPERDRVLAAEFERFEAQLDEARAEAARTGAPITVDGARISLTASGDAWTVHPDGRMEREYERFEGFEAVLDELASPPELDPTRAPAVEQVLAAAYHAFWSPSATNWQPTRVIELSGAERAAFLELAGWERDLAAPVLVLLRRDHYESLLGDVLEPFGLAVTAREESIDAGIFAQTMAMSALAAGLTFREHVVTEAERERADAAIARILEARRANLGTSPEAQRETTKIDTLLGMLERGRYLVDSVLTLGMRREPASARFPRFEELIEAHSTQRVASPTRDYPNETMAAFWDRTRDALSMAERERVEWAFFHWEERTPPAIGSAMFEALYGLGADPEAKTGGEGGLLTAVTVRNYLVRLAQEDATFVRDTMGDDWESLLDADLQRAARQLPVRGQDVGRYWLERILRDGKYVLSDGIIQDTNGKFLSVPVLVRLNKSLASTFGNFFLKFQNTHPQNAVVLARTGSAETHLVYRTVGKAGAVLTYLSRAHGASSILKTGPIDLARDPIAEILARNLDGHPTLAAWGDAIRKGELLPAMTFQVGFPLAGSEVIDVGTPNEHTGYEERRRDKRPPRDRFVDHFLPAL